MLDGLVGAEYVKGLQRLKAKVEGDRAPTARPVIVPPQAVAPAAPEGGEPSAGGNRSFPRRRRKARNSRPHRLRRTRRHRRRSASKQRD
ncbi:hypothetical protein AUC71_11085 [Methyloceanibacter marginalis]|uniref:Uncharacterized protein n=1 Tax=Methyloceanibacter marginalis TaxID=1774971 RepID=A0A1E3WCD5_9HYPH|nr:hypothetical protein AUC71_11085 [Methyloceanibacter marginalis]